MGQFLSVKNFERYQHYHTNKPKWIKFYHDFCQDYAVFDLSDATKFHIIGLFSLCSQSNNCLPFNKKWIRKRLNAKSRIDYDVILKTGLIVLHNGDFKDNFSRETLDAEEEKREYNNSREEGNNFNTDNTKLKKLIQRSKDQIGMLHKDSA